MLPPQIESLIKDYVERSREILQDDLVGVYLHGSSVMGCFNPDKSDIDLIVVVDRRLSDAVKDGDKVYAVIRTIGASSDGKGKGITAPNPKGQKIAVEKTFEQLDYTPGEVGLIEAHGTSTRVGDAVELNALYDIFAPYAKPGTIGLGSVKSQIGHAKAAAGIASLIKTSLAIYHKVLPPSVNFETPNPTVD